MAQQFSKNKIEKETSLTSTQTQIGEDVRDGVNNKHNQKFINKGVLKKMPQKQYELYRFITNPYVSSGYLVFLLIILFYFCFKVAVTSKRKYPKSFSSLAINPKIYDRRVRLFRLNKIKDGIVYIPKKANTLLRFIFYASHNILFVFINRTRKLFRKPPVKKPKNPVPLKIEAERYFLSKYLSFKDWEYLIYNFLWSLFISSFWFFLGFAVYFWCIPEGRPQSFKVTNFNILNIYSIFIPFLYLFAQLFYSEHVNTYLKKRHNIFYLDFIWMLRFFFTMILGSIPVYALFIYFDLGKEEFIEKVKIFRLVFYVFSIIF